MPNGELRVHSFTVHGYTLGTWEQNGAILQVNPTAPVDIFSIRYVLHRSHRGSLFA